MIEVDEKQMPWSENLTMAALLETLDNVEFCSVVRLNGRLVSSPKFIETIIPDNSKIQLLPLVAGG
ncbi:MAG: thiamine biosynthesis protein ThiS [Desulfobacula sp.]|jgi:sulfur carrier protein|uniref:sulfur carrier protein ThiS n=1 Tax=Desulfobacula sp. TaxID=2593537 RepID=UPI001D1CD710|nr:thiamine biosynthesis protein ThiS [Desulfobacula sp.]MBT3804586.1 thiamine biosynthesis protein ThiS [Desulfobacula sp.]MBT4025121.1 thiamine biosynthesis protein ThiS [Desulfobacula sp.]MBT4198274.1 thiamine biosynthesis protein ThiS [Desulfobacula sp.]MBT4506227.1 thiamine biosynthesis protein ThiS [Desulfobacula sp.]